MPESTIENNNNQSQNFASDIEAVNAIDAVPTILEVICRTTGMGFAAVARVTDTKWIACAVKDEINFGLVPGGELTLETTICHEIRQHQQPVVIDWVEKNEKYRSHHTPLQYGFQSYISVPLFLKNGEFFGTLCAIDPRPAIIDTPQIRGMFTLFAELIAFHLDASEKLATKDKTLLEARKTSELRDQFIAILGHDLRNPVGAISAASQLLLRMGLSSEADRLSKMILDAAFRVRALTENLLDFARGKMGEGIILHINAAEPFEAMLKQVVEELRVTMPDRIIQTEFALPEPVNCDARRVSQLLSNILGNALTHGQPDAPVYVKAVSNNGKFLLSVCNHGHKISDAVMEHLFKPFYRNKVGKQEGLGLGLYIASEIARAHGSSINVESTNELTCFSFELNKMPI